MKKNFALSETLRTFRKNRKIRSNQLANSPTRFSNIETNGDLRFSEWIEYLEKVELTPEEFIAFYKHHEKQKNPLHEIEHLLKNAYSDPEFIYNQRKIVEYFDILNNKKSKSTAEFCIYVEIKIYFCDKYEEIPPLDYQDYKTFYELFSQKIKTQEFYTYYDYRLFSNIVFELPIIELSKTENIFQILFPIKHSLKRDPHTLYSAYLAYPNFITRLLYEKKYEKAQSYLNQTKQIAIPKDQYFIHLQLNYLQALLEYLTDKTGSTYKQLENIINSVNFYGYKELSQQMTKEVDLLTAEIHAPTSGDYPKFAMKTLD
ncbi:MutR family transcriptional regulator [Enterococcus faecalis]|uniref:MutR family transcriptional regulator n=1 Tax=Enterococcus faecalis TaxID=1351 RepID=UPI003CC5589D|nr:MutR family transcriptional regulator [Enterococcus faecalis]